MIKVVHADVMNPEIGTNTDGMRLAPLLGRMIRVLDNMV
jgi:hypothetical protein